MIGSLRGRVIDVSLAWALVEVQGVGYRVNISPSVLTSLKVGEETFFYIHDHIREDSQDLYGFLSSSDLALFEKLLTISGVGPKVGMTLLAVGSAEVVRQAIMSGDLATLTSVPGVGKKTAQKIVLELKGQLVEPSGSSPLDKEVLEALQGLGYTANQARDVVKQLPADVTDASDRIRLALKFLSV